MIIEKVIISAKPKGLYRAIIMQITSDLGITCESTKKDNNVSMRVVDEPGYFNPEAIRVARVFPRDVSHYQFTGEHNTGFVYHPFELVKCKKEIHSEKRAEGYVHHESEEIMVLCVYSKIIDRSILQFIGPTLEVGDQSMKGSSCRCYYTFDQWGSASIYYSVSLTFYSGYVLLFDESNFIALCARHQWIGSLFFVGAFTHFAISVVGIDWHTLVLDIFNVLSMNSDIILGHLSWVVTFFGVNASGLYVHNDTLLALNRIPDTFSDAAIVSTPLISALSLSGKVRVSSAGLLVYW